MKLDKQITKFKIHGKRLLVIGLLSAMFCGVVNMDEAYAQKSSDAGETKAAGENVRKRDMEFREISYEEELEQIILAWGSEEQKASWKEELLNVQKETEKKQQEAPKEDSEKVGEKKSENNATSSQKSFPVWLPILIVAGIVVVGGLFIWKIFFKTKK